jgi:hypothetical protein
MQEASFLKSINKHFLRPGLTFHLVGIIVDIFENNGYLLKY